LYQAASAVYFVTGKGLTVVGNTVARRDDVDSDPLAVAVGLDPAEVPQVEAGGEEVGRLGLEG